VSGDVNAIGLAVSCVLVVAAIALSRWQDLRLERDMVTSVARSLVQMLIVGAGLGLIVANGTPIFWSWLWVAGMVLFAAATMYRRAGGRDSIPGIFRISLLANAVTAGIGLLVTFGLQIFPVDGRTVVPIAGMLVGNSMKSGVVAVQRLTDDVAARRPEIEARLALGLPWTQAARPIVRSVLRTAISPQVENTKGLGIVFLPGAMTGLVLAGVDPVKAVLVQLALMYLILGGVATMTATATLAAVRQLFTPDHRLVAIVRSTRDE
jgi:putative ABC transport system permease protein